MPFMADTAWNIARRKLIASPTEVEEPAGFQGEWVTVTASVRDAERGYRSKPFRVKRDAEVYATRGEAMAASRKMLKTI